MLLDEQGQPVAEPSQPAQVPNEPPSEVPQPPGQGEAPSPSPSGEDTEAGRYQYWQKQAEEWRLRAEEREIYAPVINYLKQNPHVIDKIEEELKTSQTSVAAPSGDKRTARPARPAKPLDYDPVEATTDPKSASFKYRQDMERYQEELVAYIESQDERRAQEERAYYEELQKQQMMRQRMNETYNQLVTAYKMSPEEANEFIAQMTRKESLNLDNLVTLFRIKKQKQAGQPNTSGQKPPTRSDVPLPAAVAGGENQPTMDDNQAMSTSMLDWAKRNRWPGSVPRQ